MNTHYEIEYPHAGGWRSTLAKATSLQEAQMLAEEVRRNQTNVGKEPKTRIVRHVVTREVIK